MVPTCPASHIFHTGGYYHFATITIFRKSTTNNIPRFLFPQVIDYDKIPVKLFFANVIFTYKYNILFAHVIYLRHYVHHWMIESLKLQMKQLSTTLFNNIK